MSVFQSAGDVKEIHADWWPSGFNVTIRKFTWGDVQDITEASTTFDVDLDGGSGGDMQAGFSIARNNRMKMIRGIKSWTFKNDTGEDVKVSPRTIDLLNPRDGAFILAEIEAFNPDDEVDAKMIERAENRVDQKQARLNELMSSGDASPEQLELAEKQLEAAKEYLTELEDRAKDQRAQFQETETGT